MCGISGVVSSGRVEAALLERMAGAISHRGPDDQGVWIDAGAGIGLGHRRLSIVDLSPSGRQPMPSTDGRFVLSYNGELYNHAALRSELETAGGGPSATAAAWRGHSDTETLIECIAAWGLLRTLEKCVGMFALALWDRRERTLQLARDRFGEKPLYYGWAGGDFVFASELKALRTHPRFSNSIDRRALNLLASRAYVPAPLSIYEGIYKLEPGCIFTVEENSWRKPLASPPSPDTDSGSSGLRLERYWSYRDAVEAGAAGPILDEREALERLEQTLAAAIGGQAVADVPVGAFLSGGIDSSTVVGLYQKYSPTPVRTFSIGFEEAGFDEAPHARAVARHFGTDHNERYMSAREALEVIPLLPSMYDEPFADSSQIPTHLVSRFAREQVTVAISGDGGDELFGGYVRHIQAPRLWAGMQRLPAPLRSAASTALAQLPPSAWDRLSRVMPGGRRRSFFGTKVQKGLRVMGRANSLDEVYAAFLDQWSAEGSPVISETSASLDGALRFDLDGSVPDAARMMYCDAMAYLPDDILCKVDRAAMAVSLETRVPFLDHRVAELAARIPIGMKIRGGEGKHILRQLLYREAPRALFERPKAGFALPMGGWLRGPLRPWAEELLDPRRMREDGFFKADIVETRWRQHLRGERDASEALWPVLMFEAWRAEQGATSAPALPLRAAAAS